MGNGHGPRLYRGESNEIADGMGTGAFPCACPSMCRLSSQTLPKTLLHCAHWQRGSALPVATVRLLVFFFFLNF